MKKFILLLTLVFCISTVEAKSNYRKQRHQNRVFQKYIQTPMKYKGTYSWSFRPKGQSILPKLF